MSVSTQTKLFAHLTGSLVAIAIALVFLVNAYSIGEVATGDSIGARGMPLFLSAILLFCGLIDFGSTLYSHRHNDLSFEPNGILFAVIVLIGLGIYVYLLGTIGFLAATSLFCAAGFKVIAGNSFMISGLKAISISAVFVVIFQLLLRTNLPEGLLGGLL